MSPSRSCCALCAPLLAALAHPLPALSDYHHHHHHHHPQDGGEEWLAALGATLSRMRTATAFLVDAAAAAEMTFPRRFSTLQHRQYHSDHHHYQAMLDAAALVFVHTLRAALLRSLPLWARRRGGLENRRCCREEEKEEGMGMGLGQRVLEPAPRGRRTPWGVYIAGLLGEGEGGELRLCVEREEEEEEEEEDLENVSTNVAASASPLETDQPVTWRRGLTGRQLRAELQRAGVRLPTQAMGEIWAMVATTGTAARVAQQFLELGPPGPDGKSHGDYGDYYSYSYGAQGSLDGLLYDMLAAAERRPVPARPSRRRGGVHGATAMGGGSPARRRNVGDEEADRRDGREETASGLEPRGGQ